MLKATLLCITLALSGSVMAATSAEIIDMVTTGERITHDQQQQLDAVIRKYKKQESFYYAIAQADYETAQERLDEPAMKDASNRMMKSNANLMQAENMRYKALAATHVGDKKEPAAPDLFGDLSSGKQSSADKKAAADAKKKAASDKAAASTRNAAPVTKAVDIAPYAGQVQQAIKSKLYDTSLYTGQQCTLRIELARDGTLNAVSSEGGNPELCQAAIAAAKAAKIPAPPSDEVWQAFKSAVLTFRL